ncbi:MAG: 3-isopropylmalate dehydratase small subunit [Alphaproteobacteria bacterium]|nr:3-isopropylmalate dehydratase small subunit [Alphaproteobacteria bacterium]
MDNFDVLTGKAAPLMRANIDTDAILPSRYLTRSSSQGKAGFGQFLFADWRFDDAGKPRPDFVLNRPEYKGAQILLAGENMGCGSSREHAPWALKGFGIRCVIAPSFGEIFFNNCFKNFVLPIALDAATVGKLAAQVEAGTGNRTMTVDLRQKTITAPDGSAIGFTIDEQRRQALLKGLDPIGETLLMWDEITAWRTKDQAKRPWAYLPKSG